ncbi:hypothetical protein MW290_16405 [Aquincola tertiaricarbonis]|uniref:DUF4124 domain-containing protein n=1 Tax=Aquincola tertiaricarbonis TaxID=391953 RepID=A0ABY4SB49_AQUTE|nr:hypothetical protein [Aquincola tertiaricarbonis]URI10582.1 hypothetical protein MW290_16405 [Aquincola tertiaricarbonis]
MKPSLPRLLKLSPALCALSLLTATAAESTVYRCGPQGNHYSQLPCQDGRALTLDDARSEAQRSAAERSIQRDQALADRLREERHEREAGYATAGRGPGAIRGVPAEQPSASRLADWQRANATKPKPAKKQKKQKQPSLTSASG